VGIAPGQFSHQVISLRVDDVRVLCAGIAECSDLRHEFGACII
jgi:hypothetical protein